MKRERKPFDFGLFLIIMGLLAFGLIMVFSASSESARSTYDDPLYFIKRQGAWAIISTAAMLFVSKIDYRIYKKYSKAILVLSLVLLVLVLAVGTEVNGGKRWLSIGNLISFQPSEFAKLAIILVFATSLSDPSAKIKSFTKGLLPYLGIIGVYALLLILEPHLSGTVVVSAIGVVMLFIAGANMFHMLAIGLAGGSLGMLAIFTSEYRRKRLFSFLDPFADKLGDGWQITQSLYAIGSGGMFGLGLGRSRQKFLYIPEPHNDFIFAIICEELGFAGAVFTILLFAILIFKGVSVSLKAPDEYGRLVAAGITTLIAMEAIINIAVVTSSIPVTGISLPFFSYGGTALLMHMVCMGILLNISRHTQKAAVRAKKAEVVKK